MIRIDNIKINEDLNNDEVIKIALKRNNINVSDVIDTHIVKKSIDARRKDNVHYVFAIDVLVSNEEKYSNLNIVKEEKEEVIEKNRKSDYRPVIVGAGPAGLFCALTFVDNGYKPIIIEQGSSVIRRKEQVELYRNERILNEVCNVQFGEGGAGTFSDGKLTTGISSPLVKKVLDYFYRFGAPEEILYLSKPHIGTDNLINILVKMRKYIEENGGTYFFDTKFINFEKNNNEIKVVCEDKEFVTDALVLAIGHSAKDTIRMLYGKKMEMVRKNFAVGVRIEHKQQMINDSQYGTLTKLKLPAAEYKLVYHDPSGRSCFSFCMCPGGEVIASASEKETIVTNGMSNFKRDGENANSALLVNVNTDDFGGDNVLAGLDFQEKLEHSAFVLGGSNYNAPVQRFGDFRNNVVSDDIGNIIPTYKPGYTLSNLNEILPKFISDTLKDGITYFGTKIKGFDSPDAILTGVETRSSSPVTILRDDELMSSIKGIYPCGEGAGFAGGITSAAVDGIKVAQKIIEKE